jgi:hypothetical protein
MRARPRGAAGVSEAGVFVVTNQIKSRQRRRGDIQLPPLALPLNLRLQMLAYRSDDRPVDARSMLTGLIRSLEALDAPAHDSVVALFIELSEFESAVADREFARCDGLSALTTLLRSAALRAAHGLLASWKRDPLRRNREFAGALALLRTIHPGQLPPTIALRVSEGYAYYALHPESYATAAVDFLDTCRPETAVCIGIRSIGASLSAIVAAALERNGVPATLHSIRPRGHPFDRVVVLADELAQAWRTAPPQSYFLVIDEGPGLSGSSFASVVRALTRLGVHEDRIILFPSWNPDGASFRSEDARTIWRRQRRFCSSTAGTMAAAEDAGESIDLSSGAWRAVFCSDPTVWPAVQPQHERTKRWHKASGAIVRFAGLGGYGATKQKRAEALADAGLGAAPLGLANGSLSLQFVDGQPCSQASQRLIDAVAAHLSFLTTRFPATRSPGADAMIEMATTNVRLGLGDHAPAFDLERYRPALDGAPCAAIDGRMLPHEWVETGRAFVKVDALDHHNDHFFPGTQDAGWDLAAAVFEFDLDRSERDRLVGAYAAASGDRDVAARLPFYAVAYPAFRLGYATLASAALGHHADARRFDTVAARCRARLRQVLTSPNGP